MTSQENWVKHKKNAKENINFQLPALCKKWVHKKDRKIIFHYF